MEKGSNRTKGGEGEGNDGGPKKHTVGKEKQSGSMRMRYKVESREKGKWGRGQ